MLNLCLCLVAGLLLLTSSADAQINGRDAESLPEKIVEAELPSSHPSSYYFYAKRLFKAGRKDDAVFWFYAGQLRYRFHLSTPPALTNEEDRELMNNLNDMIGKMINEYAGGDPPGMAARIQDVLEWDTVTPNLFTSKETYSTAWHDTRQGLSGLREHILRNADYMRREREKQGLPNR